MMKIDQVKVAIREIGEFSPKLEQVLGFLLGENDKFTDELQKTTAILRSDIEAQLKDITDESQSDKKTLLDMMRQSHEDQRAEMKELEMLTKSENDERKRETQRLIAALNEENEKRVKEGQLLKDKMEKEKKELQAYLEQDAKEMKSKMETDSRALKEKLDQEANALKDKLTKENELRTKESKALAEKLEKDKALLAKQLESGTRELNDQLAKEEERRRKEAQELKAKLEDDKKEHGNEITQMFDRLKSENELRKQEVHGLKDILVRENDKRIRETEDLRVQVESGMQQLMSAVEKETAECKMRLQTTEDELTDAMKKDKKEVRERMDTVAGDMKKKMEIETNEMRERMQVDKKSMLSNLAEENDERRKEIQLLKNNLNKDREDLRAQMECDVKVLLDQLEKDSGDILGLLKKERSERERELALVKERIHNEKKELQISIDKDRDNFTRKMNEEHDQRRLEQMEMKERLDNNEKASKADIQDLYHKVKREIEAREQENDELVQDMKTDRAQMEEKLIKERQTFREALTAETLDIEKRMEKLNVERVNDNADIQAKVAMLGKSASRHIDNLKHYVFRECQSLFDLATKPCSVVFNAYRDESYVNGGEDYLTFSGCTVNIGNGMNPKSGEFKCPEGGLYLFLFTCCTFDMKKCLISIRKNGKDVTNFHDQDGDQNKGKTMIGQNVLLELIVGDKVQIYTYTATGITDHKNSRYTQFIGLLMRPSVDSMHEVVRRLGATDLEDDVSVVDDSVRSTTSTLRGLGLNNGESMRESRKGRSRTTSRVTSPPPSSSSSALTSTLDASTSVARAMTPSLGPNSDLASTEVNIDAGLKPNGNGAKLRGSSPSSPKVGTSALNGAQNGRPSMERDSRPQSYLALTSLGGNKKSVENGNKKSEGLVSKMEREKTPTRLSTAKKPALGKTYNPANKIGNGGGSALANLASSTLKGFTKM